MILHLIIRDINSSYKNKQLTEKLQRIINPEIKVISSRVLAGIPHEEHPSQVGTRLAINFEN